jgi:hypothetical protein
MAMCRFPVYMYGPYTGENKKEYIMVNLPRGENRDDVGGGEFTKEELLYTSLCFLYNYDEQDDELYLSKYARETLDELDEKYDRELKQRIDTFLTLQSKQREKLLNASQEQVVDYALGLLGLLNEILPTSEITDKEVDIFLED